MGIAKTCLFCSKTRSCGYLVVSTNELWEFRWTDQWNHERDIINEFRSTNERITMIVGIMGNKYQTSRMTPENHWGSSYDDIQQTISVLRWTIQWSSSCYSQRANFGSCTAFLEGEPLKWVWLVVNILLVNHWKGELVIPLVNQSYH